MGVVTARMLGRIAQRRYWTERDGAVVIAAWRQSGQTQARFARRHGIHPKRLSWWIARFRRARGDELRRAAAVRFHPVRVVGPETRPGAAVGTPPIEIVLAHGAAIRVPSGARVEDVALVLRAVMSDGERERC